MSTLRKQCVNNLDVFCYIGGKYTVVDKNYMGMFFLYWLYFFYEYLGISICSKTRVNLEKLTAYS